jgi:hypothetical protein
MRAAWVLLFAGCGTYSMIRPANVLERGKVEIAGGLAVSQLEANTVGHVAVGLGHYFEVLAQNEIWNTFAELRYQAIEDSIDLSVGLGGGYATTLLATLTSSGSNENVQGAAATVSIAVGHTWGKRFSLTLGNRSFFLSEGYLATSTRLGVRLRIVGPLGVLLEGGATYHAPLGSLGLGLLIGEGTGGLYLAF